MSSKIEKISLAKAELWKRGNLRWMLDSNQKTLYDILLASKTKTNVWKLSRRCLAEGTMVKTIKGIRAIEELKVGDYVLGVNQDGSISPAKITETFNNGEQEVVELISSKRIIEECTEDHIWKTTSERTLIEKLSSPKNIKKGYGIERHLFKYEHEGVSYKEAYALGALFGDGCRIKDQKDTRRIQISSENKEIPEKIANILGLNVKKNAPKSANFTWTISSMQGENLSKYPSEKIDFLLYAKYCKNKLAHEKTIDLEIVKAWDYESQLAFLAGLIDTDGSVSTGERCLIIHLCMQAKSIIEAAQYIIHNLFQYKCKIRVDNRDKYKNGPVYTISIKNNLFVNIILKELDRHLVTTRKKWKKEYDSFLVNNSTEERVGVKIGNKKIKKTYDITIENDSSLFLTANGLVTHNCGKSHALCVIALEVCLKNPMVVVKMVAPTKDQVNTVTRPLFYKILQTCPEDIQPKWKEKNYIYRFANGSEIQLAGIDAGNAERLRGGEANLCIVDEAGFCSDLKYVVRDILLPTTLTTGGKIILASTPPPEEDHDFYHFEEIAEAKKTLTVRTIWDNPRLTRTQIEEFIEEEGGINSETVRRELFCEKIRNSSKVVFSEFTPDLEKFVVRDWIRPSHFTTYEAMDIGWKDYTALLFAYYDFRAAKIIIEDEILLRGMEIQLPKLVEAIKQKEQLRFFILEVGEVVKPHKRVSDYNQIVTQEMSRISNNEIVFTNAKKDELEVAINQVKVLLEQQKIIINPRCVGLIRHLRNAKWSTSKTKNEFSRSEADGHYDLAQALIYLVRAINFRLNPYPPSADINFQDLFVTDPAAFNKRLQQYKSPKSQLEIYKKIFNVKDRKNGSRF